MHSAATKLNTLLEHLEEDDYEKAVSYIEFLITRKKERTPDRLQTADKTDTKSIVASLLGAIPDTGK